jgi:hypothetical protein
MVDRLNRRSDRRTRVRPLVALTAAALALTPALAASSAQAASAVPLGTAESFAVLGGSTITNTGATTITGDVGLCCTGVAMPGFGSVIQPRGAQYAGTGTPAQSGQDDLDIAYGDAAGQAVSRTVPVDLSLTGTPATPLLPGVYESTAHGALQITTGLTLDFQGDPNAVFIFQGTELITAAGAAGSVNIVNGGSAPSTCNVVWQLSDATQGVTLGSSSAFKGTTLALGASVLGSGATVQGRILTRRSKAVTLDNNTITQTACATAAGGGGAAPTPSAPGPSASTPTSSRPKVSPTPTPTPAAGSPASGTAKLTGPGGAVSGPFSVAVTGRAIRQVVFYVDGRRRSIVRARPGRTRFALRINPRGQSRRVHRVTVRVTFTPRSGTTTVTRRLTYRRDVPAPRPPRFTG